MNKRALDGTTKPCEYQGCEKPATSRRAPYCSTHEMRVRRHGDVSIVKRDPTPLALRWRSEISVDANGCWIWPHLSKEGYGMASDGRPVWMHRWVWSHLRGPIPRGMELDHLCKKPACCNPDHLEPVSPRENKQRQRSANAEKTHCKNGHEFTPENTYITRTSKGGLRRVCRTCGRAWTADYLARSRAARSEMEH